VRRCASCGTDLAPIRDDGECFRCHLQGIGFAFAGGGGYGRHNWNTTHREFIDQHVGVDNIRDGTVERVR